MQRISYKKGYKYWLTGPYVLSLPIAIPHAITSSGGFVTLSAQGYLTIMQGYAWNGASGPAIDTDNFMRGSLVHDALYQLIREGALSPEHRKTADDILRSICIEDGMSRLRAWWVWSAVRRCGGLANKPRKILYAP